MASELEKSPKSPVSVYSTHSLSPIPDLNDFNNDDDNIPTTTPYTITSAQIVPVHDRVDINLQNDDDEDIVEQKKKEKVIDRISIIVDSRKNVHTLKHRYSVDPDADDTDDQFSPRSPGSDTDIDHYHAHLQKPKDIGYVATLQNSASGTNSDNSHKFTLNNICNMPTFSITDKSSINRNNSPGFTLNSIQENTDADSTPVGTQLHQLRDLSSGQVFTTQTSTFDMIGPEDISICSSFQPKKTYGSANNLPKMRSVVHTHLDPNNQKPSNINIHHSDDEEEDFPTQASLEPSVSHEQVKNLTNYIVALTQDHEKLKSDLNNIFNVNGVNGVNGGSEGVTTTSPNIKNINNINPPSVDKTHTPSMSSTIANHHIVFPYHNEHVQHMHQCQYKYDVAFLVSQPILHSTGSEVLPVEPLNCEDEEKAIQEAFSSSGRKINYVRKFATVNNLRKLVTAGTQIIHYCGHGIRKALIFENDMAQQIGMSHRLSANHLRKLISAGHSQDNSASNISLVFVSACHSEDAGKAFVNAGAAHVVAVKRTAEMHDIAAGTFTKQFYFALVNGKTVKQAFDIANESIQAQFLENNYLKNEALKFVLLPKKAEHNVTLFDKVASNDTFNKYKFIDHTSKRGIKKFPQPPLSEWVGRFKSIHDLMHNILSDNLVVISCDKGLGKTAMICRTLHYLWDRSLLAGIYYFNIYQILKKNPSLSIAQIVFREMFPKQKKNNINNKDLIAILQQEEENGGGHGVLIVFEDIDEFEYEHLAEDQRIDIFIEELLGLCDNVKLLLTLGTPVNQCSFLAKLDKRVVKLKPLKNEQSIKLLEIYLQKHFSLNKIRSSIPLEKIASFCKGYPLLIKYAASQFQNDDDLSNLNLRKQIREQVLTEFEALKMTRYWKELSLERNNLRIGELKQRIRQRDGQELWEEMYGYRSRGLLNTLLYRMKEWYREHVGDAQFRCRPIWTYYELEFIQMELLPFLAKNTKSTFKPPKEVVQRLETNEYNKIMADHNGNKSNKKKWYHFGGKSKNKKPQTKKQKIFLADDDDDNKVSEDEKIPIEVFAEFFEFWKELWRTMLEPKVSPFYFKKDEICLIAGMMCKDRALTIISQYAKGTFLIRFSKQNAGSLVLVVSTGPDQKPSQHKIYINKNIDDGTITFEYQTVRKGIHRSNSLYDLFNHLQFLEHLWYKKRGNEQEYIQTDKRKILKFFKSRADVWKL